MNVTKNFFPLVIAIIMLISCSSTKTGSKNSTEEPVYKSVAAKKLGTGAVEYLFNASNTVVVCMKASKPTNLMPQHHIIFFVYDVAGDAILHEDEIANGDVTWNNDYQIKVTMIPGIIKDDDKAGTQPSGYMYDIRLKKKIDLSSSDIQKLN
ncbi:MAG: hypothetical protein HY276_06790 [Ignavibacteriales bacterium]|nr:hypothetical protein [Ignavibacteriales bacterium]MBI3787947.1 hypothetical protein [Ignavibacteriales bacterium]